MPWLIGLVLIWIGLQSVQAPNPSSENAPDTEFSAGRAIKHVAMIAAEPHPMGSDANAAVRGYIVDELQNLGLEPELYSTTAPDFFGSDRQVPVVNVVARIPGSANTRAVALMAHYDTVPTTAGANDNSSAVATLLETARAFTSGLSVNNDLLLLFTDGEEEEAPRFGASALIQETSLADEIGFVVNLEAIGGSGPSMLVETGGPDGWIVREYAAAPPRPIAFSFITELVELIGDVGTDFDPFRNAGVPGLHLVYLRARRSITPAPTTSTRSGCVRYSTTGRIRSRSHATFAISTLQIPRIRASRCISLSARSSSAIPLLGRHRWRCLPPSCLAGQRCGSATTRWRRCGGSQTEPA